MTAAEHKSDFDLTKDTPYLALMGELWHIYCEDVDQIHHGTTLTALFSSLWPDEWWVHVSYSGMIHI